MGVFSLVAGLAVAWSAFALAQNEPDQLALRWQDHFNDGDAAGLAALYTDDAYFRHASGLVTQGTDEIQAWAQETIEAGLTFEVSVVNFEMLSDEIAYSLEQWAAMASDGTVVLMGESVAINVLQGGEWKISKHFSGSLPLQPKATEPKVPESERPYPL